MADREQQVTSADPSSEMSQVTAHEVTQSFLSGNSSGEKDENGPIPGFPPLFQFAKVQTEATSWNTASTSSDGVPASKPSVVVLSEKEDKSVASEGTGNREDSVPVPEMETDEKPMSISEEWLEKDQNDGNTKEKAEDGAINDEPDEEEAESDPYFYTKRDEFTSEIYKIELQNLPKKCGYKVTNNCLGFRKMVYSDFVLNPGLHRSHKMHRS